MSHRPLRQLKTQSLNLPQGLACHPRCFPGASRVTRNMVDAPGCLGNGSATVSSKANNMRTTMKIQSTLFLLFKAMLLITNLTDAISSESNTPPGRLFFWRSRQIPLQITCHSCCTRLYVFYSFYTAKAYSLIIQ